MTEAPTTFSHPDVFINRHLGSGQEDVSAMLKTLGFSTMAEMVSKIVPESIRTTEPLAI